MAKAAAKKPAKAKEGGDAPGVLSISLYYTILLVNLPTYMS